MLYSVEYKKSALKEIEGLEKRVQKQILDAIDELENNPRPSGVDKISGSSNLWRIRVGKYRVIYRVQDDKLLVMVVRVAHRSEVYNNLPI